MDNNSGMTDEVYAMKIIKNHNSLCHVCLTTSSTLVLDDYIGYKKRIAIKGGRKKLLEDYGIII